MDPIGLPPINREAVEVEQPSAMCLLRIPLLRYLHPIRSVPAHSPLPSPAMSPALPLHSPDSAQAPSLILLSSKMELEAAHFLGQLSPSEHKSFLPPPTRPTCRTLFGME